LSQFKWYAWKPGKRRTFYAVRGIALPNGKRGVSYMHREILDASHGTTVDHKDGNGINNQRSNLRIGSQRQNTYNQAGWRISTSKFKGVSRHRSRPQWRSRIMIDGKEHFLGYFNSEVEAARAYDKAARANFGEFARPNFPSDDSCRHGGLVTDADIERAQAEAEADIERMEEETEEYAEEILDREFWAGGQW
jgi:hypothetical protein